MAMASGEERRSLTSSTERRVSTASRRSTGRNLFPTTSLDAAAQVRRRHRRRRKFFSGEKFKRLLFHLSLVLFCCVYVLAGAALFYLLERPIELAKRDEVESLLTNETRQLLERLADSRWRRGMNFPEFESHFNAALDEYMRFLFEQFEHPLKANYFHSLAYNNGSHDDLWSFPSAILFTSTTIIPVGFGHVAPMSSSGRLILILYSIIGLPLALMTLSDIGKFLCALLFRCFNNSIPMTMFALSLVLFAYPWLGALLIQRNTELSLVDSYYFCLQCLFTIGFGDMQPAIPLGYLVLFIVVGVMLVTISIEVLASGIIHQVHFMGRQVGRARELASRLVHTLNKMSRDQMLGLGLIQMNIFSRLGGRPVWVLEDEGECEVMRGRPARKSVAFEPKNLDLNFVDFD